ncbi:MAG TPA: HAMP domain-containing histidine kinase [Candidatus Blautia stercoravium]|nr:HAMP domain-containing histidine kinase [Candidatus Blautia stercoravium]
MNSVLKLIRRFFGILVLSLVFGIVLNVGLLLTYTLGNQRSILNGEQGPWSRAEMISAELQQEGETYVLSRSGRQLLEEAGAWAQLIENGSGKVVWSSGNLPQEIPNAYTYAEMDSAVRGYVKDYPTVSVGKGADVLLIGYPKKAYWKHMSPMFDYQIIAKLPIFLLLFCAGNLLFIIVVYAVSVSGVLKAVKPIIEGIRQLPENHQVYVKETGLLSQMAASINQAAGQLRSQEHVLKKKETARSNWIAGVSHDIRTPLSMVMGYAGQLEEDEELSKENRRKARVIRLQSLRMKNLINDLNLASKLEYQVQPLHPGKINAVAFLRKIAVDFLNLDGEDKYPVEWAAKEKVSAVFIWGDEELLKRAVSNLIYNAQVHNPKGCTITLEVKKTEEMCCLAVSDDGVGVTEEALSAIQKKPHYMVCDSQVKEQSHGLGLLIVRQIAQAHGGRVELSHAPQGGFQAEIFLPLLPEKE